MLQSLFHIGRFAVPSHEFFIGVGLLAALVVFVVRAKQRGRLDDQTKWVVLGALAGGGIFARAAAVWQYSFTGNNLVDFWLHGGRSVLGGLAGAYAGAVVTKRLVGYRGSTGDLFAPAVAIGMAIGRVGCFLTEQVGTASSLPWAITLSPEVAATVPACPACAGGAAMHPSFLYEVAFHAVAFAVLWRTRDRLPDGESFKLYLLAYGTFRFGVEFVRGNPVMALGLSGSQLFLLVTMPLLVFTIFRKSRNDTLRSSATLEGVPV